MQHYRFDITGFVCARVCMFVYVVVVVVVTSQASMLHRQVGVGIVVILGSICCVMFSTRAWYVRDMGSIPTLCIMIPIFITCATLVAVTMILYTVWWLNLPSVGSTLSSVGEVTTYMCVIVRINSLQFQGDGFSRLH